ncbi:MAG: hypothetical protein JKY74_02060, partial [Shewanella sp.]|nr:hypothetical protein [Shewanella sp.]
MTIMTKEMSAIPTRTLKLGLTLAMIPELEQLLGDEAIEQKTADNILTLWIDKHQLIPAL